MGRMVSLPWRRTAGLALAVALAVLVLGSAIRPAGAERAYDQGIRDCEAQGGWVTGNDPQGAHTYWCFLPGGRVLYCVFFPGSTITNVCAEDVTPPRPQPDDPPRPGDPGIAPPLTRPPDDGTFDAVDLNPKPAMQAADDPAPASSSGQASTGATMQLAANRTARQIFMMDDDER